MADDSSKTAGKVTQSAASESAAPQVSVIMPCYNAASTVEQAVDSALRQQVRVEVIILNDCSDDGTLACLQRYKDDERVRIYTNSGRLGAAGSRNAGVRLARAPYVAFLDADDMWREDKLVRQLKTLRSTHAVLCCTGRELISDDGSRTGRIIGVKEKITYRDELKSNWINCSSVLLRTKTALAYPMAHEDAHEDYITWLRMLRDLGPACGIDEPMLIYRQSGKGKSGTKLKSARMTFLSYRYAGLGYVRSTLCFVSYAFHGVLKYVLAAPRFQQHRRLHFMD